MKELDKWGEKIQPAPPVITSMTHFNQMWRNSLVLTNLLFLTCTKCKQSFAILRDCCKKTIACPYCSAPSRYEGENYGKLLARLCKDYALQEATKKPR